MAFRQEFQLILQVFDRFKRDHDIYGTVGDAKIRGVTFFKLATLVCSPGIVYGWTVNV